MFVNVPDGRSPKTYAIIENSMVENHREYGNETVYDFNAYWFVDSGSTKGALAYGVLSLEFCDDFAPNLDGLMNYRNLNVQTVLDISDNLPESPNPNENTIPRSGYPKKVRTSAQVVFGNMNAWTSGVSDAIFKKVVDIWFNLPQQSLPEGATKWLKFRKN